MFSTQSGKEYSRLILYYTAGLHFVLGFLTRSGYKKFLQYHGSIAADKRSMLAVLKVESAEEMVGRLLQNPAEPYHLMGLVLDGPSEMIEINSVPVVCNLEESSDYTKFPFLHRVGFDGDGFSAHGDSSLSVFRLLSLLRLTGNSG